MEHSRHVSRSLAAALVLVLALFTIGTARSVGAQENTSLGTGALASNTTGQADTAIGFEALFSNCPYSQFRMLRKHWSFATTALSWPPCLRSCPQWFLWSPSGFGVEPLWNWRCSLSDIRWPFSIGSGQAERGLVQVTADCGPGSTELGRAV